MELDCFEVTFRGGAVCLLCRYLECCFENCLSLPVKFSTHYLLWPSLILEKMVCDSFFFFFKINELGG